MRILLISNRYPTSVDDTASPFVPHFVDALRAGGAAVDVLTPQYNDTADTDPEVHRFATGATDPIGSWSMSNPLFPIRLMRFIRRGLALGERLCQTSTYGHILALWALPSGHFARALSRRYRIPYSVWCLGSDIYSWARRPLVRMQIAGVLGDAVSVYGDGEDLCKRAQAQFGITCTYLPSFRPLPVITRTRPIRATDAPKFLYLGRIHRAKGVFDLFKAFEMVRGTLPLATLRYIGEGPAAHELSAGIGLSHVSGAIRFDGRVGHDGVIDALASSDCVVIPTKSDSLPLVFSEAVQAGTPVIGTDVGDLGCFIRRYRVGAVAPSATPRDLADTMLQMARLPVFDHAGQSRLIDDLSPARAARLFCKRSLGLTPSDTHRLAQPRISRSAKVARSSAIH
ncbi:MAG TPA: glycosyltransferase [candidate division Zixibacteria bacterium]